MRNEESASKDFVDRSILAERLLTDEKFRSRDDAIKLLAQGISGQKATHIAIGISILSFLLTLALKFLVR
jgi:hypothetical protein